MVWEQVEAKVARGQRLASGTSVRDPIFNEEEVRNGVKGKGTIFFQASAFAAMGCDLDGYFGKAGYTHGTLNLLMAPHQWTLGPREDFDYFLENVRWTDKFDRQTPNFVENFYLSPCLLLFKEKLYKGMIYIPDPGTKPRQHQPLDHYIDVIAEPIPGIGYDSEVIFFYNPAAIRVTRKPPAPNL